MVVDRQHLANCEEGTPVLPSSKKVRPSAPLNIYRPPALRKRNEALEVSSCDSSPDIVPVSRAERLRSAKQRRPDIQVYVPRAKRILATPEDNAKSAAALRSTPLENKKTSSTKKSSVDKDSRQTPSKTKAFVDKSSSHKHLRVSGGERNDLSITYNDKKDTEEVGSSCEATDLHSGIADRNEVNRNREQRDLVLCGEDDIEVIVDQNGKEEPDECGVESLSGSPVPITETHSIADDCCQCEKVQREHGECVMDECRTDFSSSLCAGNVNEPEPESVNSVSSFIEDVEGSCKTCNRTLRLCHCNDSDFLDTVNNDSGLSIGHLNSDSSENVDSVIDSIVRVGGTVVGEQNIKDCSLEQERSELCTSEDIWHKSVVVKSNISEQDSVFQKVPLEQVEEKNATVAQAEDALGNIAKNGPVSEDSVLSNELIISENSVSVVEPIMPLDSKKSDDSSGGSTDDRTCGPTAEEELVALVTPSRDNCVPANHSPVRLNPDECTWEMMFDENGDCLDPKLIEEITNAVGSVQIEKPKSDYNGYQNKPEIVLDPGDEFAHVIEIYNFPAAFKTEDLVTIFSPYKNGGFEIKWVDNTHALGIFSSSLVAADVLAAEHPFVKTRPLREASHESRMKARRSAEFLQPYKVRPETCAALARRLVTGALGVKVNVTREEREAERRLLREAKEKKRLAAKQRDEIWEGTFSAN